MTQSEATGRARFTEPPPGNRRANKLLRLVPGIRQMRILWLLAAVAVVVGSLLPSHSSAIRALERLPFSDKAEHTAMYALLVVLPGIRERRRVVLVAALSAILLGIGLEVAQLLTGWRDFEVADMLADAVGVCLGLAFAAVFRATERIETAERAPRIPPQLPSEPAGKSRSAPPR